MRRQVLLTLLLALALPATGASAASLPAGTTAIISGTPDLLGLFLTPAADSTATGHAADDDGGRIVFTSDADGLVADDDDDVRNVYVKDVASGAVQLVSRAADGQPSHVSCSDGVISGDGTKVAFICDGPLDPADQNGSQDVYLRNLAPGQETTTLVSRTPDGRAGDGPSVDPAIDQAGDFVAFSSRAVDLGGLPAGAASTERIFRREIGGADAMVLVSQTDGGLPNAEAANSPSISDSGAVVAFDTEQALITTDGNGFSDVYIRTIGVAASTTTVVSVADKNAGAAGQVGNLDSSGGIVSGDGLSVAFSSFATNLEAPPVIDTDGRADVYVRAIEVNTTRLVSTSATDDANNAATATSISDDGSVVGFTSFATNLDPVDREPGIDGYVSASGRARLVSQPTGTTGPASNTTSVVAVSGDGGSVAVGSGSALAADLDPLVTTVARRDLGADVTSAVSRPQGAAPFVNAGGEASGGSVSADGRLVAFSTAAKALSSQADTLPVVVRDVVTGQVTVVSREDGPNGAVLSGRDARISADGRRVAFVVDLELGSSQVYVRDIASARTVVASRADGVDGALGALSSEQPSISDDGSRVAFVSQATNLGDGDDDDVPDVHLRELDAGRTLLVDRADGMTGDKAAGGVGQAVLSGDGRHVVFDTLADNLRDGDADGVMDVHVRDVEAGRTRLASVNDAGVKGTLDSGSLLSISRNGNRVSFFSFALDLIAATPQVYVRDVSAGTLQIAARADGLNGDAIGFDVSDAALSADGKQFVFVAHPVESIAPGGLGDSVDGVYERDLASGATRLISRRTGAAGAPPDGLRAIRLGGVSADGGCVAFATAGRLLPGPVSADFANVYLRAVTTDCGRLAVAGPGPVTRAAVLSRLAVKPRRFHVGGRRGGTRISFRLDKASAVTLTFARLLPGHRAKAKKRAKGKKGQAGRCSTRVRKGKRCTVVKRVGRISLVKTRLHAGANSVRFTGKLGRKALARGRYRLTATPVGGTGRSVTVTVVKAPKPTKHRKAGR